MVAPETPVYGFQLERGNQPPGHSLRTDATYSPDTLGEQVEEELVRVENDISQNAQDISELEDRLLFLDRQDLTGTVGEGTSLVVPLELQGAFARYTLMVEASVGVAHQPLVVRINNDTGNNHRSTTTAFSFDGSVAASDERDADNFPRTSFLGQFGPPSQHVIIFSPRSFPNTGFVGWTVQGWANNGISGSSNIIGGGRWAGDEAPITEFRVRTNTLSDTWSSSSRATLWGHR